MSHASRQLQLQLLEERCGYSFKDRALLEQALTHRSYAKINNERLEFLGDAVVNLAAAEVLFAVFSEASEGVLSRLRSRLVRREALAEVARNFDLGELLRLGTGERKSGGRQRDSILADALEALAGAMVIDGDVGTAVVCAKAWFQQTAVTLDIADGYDPKTRLQEWLQSKGLDLPQYEVTATSGEAHELSFTVLARIDALSAHAHGVGSSRRRAEQAAARALLKQVGREG